MTPAHQPEQEYIITEKLTAEIEDVIKDMHPSIALRIPRVIRSRPHTSAPAPEHGRWRDTDDQQSCGCNTEAGYRLGYAAGAKAAREQMKAPLKRAYDKFKNRDAILSEVGCKCGDVKTATWMEIAGEMWVSIKESLRSQQEPQQEGRR